MSKIGNCQWVTKIVNLGRKLSFFGRGIERTFKGWFVLLVENRDFFKIGHVGKGFAYIGIRPEEKT